MDINLELIPANTKDANTVKHIVLLKLLEDGVITKEQFESYNYEHQVIIVKRSWLTRWWKRFYPDTNDSYIFELVKLSTK